jgi:hypothetical protein
VLKKAGIVVATAAAGLLAVSPLAFAGDKDDHDHHRENDGHKRVKVERVEHFEGVNQAEQGLVARPVAVNICNNGDFGDDIWGLVNLPLLTTPPTVDEDRNCYQRAESSVDAEQQVEQSNEND